MTLKGRRGVTIEQTVHELKTILREIILEVGELKERVAALEQAQREIGIGPGGQGEAHDVAVAENSPLAEIQAMSEDQPNSPDSLGQIYREGYHICPMAFGKRRTDGCLFCVAMLARAKA